MKTMPKKLLALVVCLVMTIGIFPVCAAPSPAGALSVTAGDINSDDKVNNKDLTRLFQYLSGWNVAVNEDVLDVNGDGKVNNKDLTRLFQHLSGWNVEIHPQVICEHDGGTEIRNAKDPNCTEKGYTGDTYCLLCNKKISAGEEIEALGHNYSTVATPPTCAEEGYTTYTCERCGYSYQDDYIAATGIHTGGTATYYQKATCDTCNNEYGDYAQMLVYDQLNESQQDMYNYLSSKIAELTKGNIYLYDYVKDNPQKAESDINVVIRAISYDHPEYFWMPRNYEVSKSFVESTGKLTDISVVFAQKNDSTNGSYHISISQKAQMQSALELKINELVTVARTYETDFEKEVFLHDYLCDNIVYNTAAAGNPSADPFAFTAYGALVNGTCVCEGYSRAMQLLCQRLDIPCGLITGTYLANVPVNSYICINCGNIYDASKTGVSFDDLQDDYVCEICQGAKDNFVKHYTLFTLRCVCNKCGWYFDEDTRGVEWDELPDSFTCENCGANKDSFSLLSKTPHMWNIINPGDGCYYLDITFDDLDLVDSPTLCTHFCTNVTKSFISLDHEFDDMYNENYDYSDPNIEYNFFDSHGEHTALDYYAVNDAYICDDTFEAVAKYVYSLLTESDKEYADFLYDSDKYEPGDVVRIVNRILIDDYNYKAGFAYGYGYHENWLYIVLKQE